MTNSTTSGELRHLSVSITRSPRAAVEFGEGQPLPPGVYVLVPEAEYFGDVHNETSTSGDTKESL